MGHANEKLLELRDMLLVQDRWPKWFSWDFGHIFKRRRSGDSRRQECGSMGCAIGLALTMWPEEIHLDWLPSWHDANREFASAESARQNVRFFGLDNHTFDRIFLLPSTYGSYFSGVTPAAVAAAITHYDKHGNMIGFRA